VRRFVLACDVNAPGRGNRDEGAETNQEPPDSRRDAEGKYQDRSFFTMKDVKSMKNG